MITVIAWWETVQMEPELEWRMWRQLKGAFGIDRFIFLPVLPSMEGYVFDQYDSVQEALATLPDGTQRVFLEPTGYRSMYDIPQGDIALILGNTDQGNMSEAQVNETYQIKTPGSADLYGINAASIALAFGYGQ